MDEKKGRKFYQRWWFWLIAVFVVVAIGSSLGGNGTDGGTLPNGNAPNGDTLPNAGAQQNGNTLTDENAQKGGTGLAPGTGSANKSTITLAEFNELKTGMTYDEAIAIIGGEGTLSSESEIAGIKTSLYTWQGEGDIGANANAMFQDGKLIQKAQFGLK